MALTTCSVFYIEYVRQPQLGFRHQFMKNSITIVIGDDPDLAALKEKKPGHTCELSHVAFKVTKNDGKVIEGEPVEVELSDEQYADEPAKATAEESLAVQAMKGE